jgi:hypothetical protein
VLSPSSWHIVYIRISVRPTNSFLKRTWEFSVRVPSFTLWWLCKKIEGHYANAPPPPLPPSLSSERNPGRRGEKVQACPGYKEHLKQGETPVTEVRKHKSARVKKKHLKQGETPVAEVRKHKSARVKKNIWSRKKPRSQRWKDTSLPGLKRTFEAGRNPDRRGEKIQVCPG